MPETLPTRTPPTISVSQLNTAIKECLEEIFPTVWVAGEVTDVSKPQSGHIYLTLKDETSQIRAVIWRSTAMNIPFKIQDGMAVVAMGQVQVYAPRGSYQLSIRQLEPQGIGALQLAFRQLHQKLAAEGLFQAERKKTLPQYPQRIGFVTSPSGAAIRDFLEVARRRWAGAHIVVIPARVQGQGAAKEIVAGIQAAERLVPKLDALVVGRGGGSMEDLWCFNEEIVVRAIAKCSLPTVSAVGHEIDVTLSDLVADQRALTPTEAAERLLPSADDLRQKLAVYASRLVQPMRYRISSLRERLERLRGRPVMMRPAELIADRRRVVDELDLRGRQAMRLMAERAARSLAAAAGKLDALSPLAVLGRGYSMTRRPETGVVLLRAADIKLGESLETSLAEGSFISRVESIQASGTTRQANLGAEHRGQSGKGP